jgi:hypothetical protein
MWKKKGLATVMLPETMRKGTYRFVLRECDPRVDLVMLDGVIVELIITHGGTNHTFKPAEDPAAPSAADA